MRILLLGMVLLVGAAGLGCARQPSEKTMVRKAKSYFRSYGREYKTTAFGLSKVDSATVEEAQEIHKGLVEGVLTLSHRDASSVRVRCMYQRNDPFGWKIVSWENLH